MSEPQTTPDPDETTTCSGCYVWGVLISLLASSFQSLGYFLWRLHHLRKQRQRVQSAEATPPQGEGDASTLPESAPVNQDTSDPQAIELGKGENRTDVVGTSDGEVVQEHRTQDETSIPEAANMSTIVEVEAKPALEEAEAEAKCWRGTSYYGVPWVWVLGLAAIGVGNGLDFVSLGLTKQSVVTLVGSWSLVVTTLISPLLGERLTKLDMWAASITIAGIILTVLGGYTEITDWSTDKLIRQYRQPHVVAMLAVLATGVAACVLLLALDFARRRSLAKSTQQPISPPNPRSIGPLYILLAALIATFTVLLGKATSEMLLPTLTGDNRFSSPAAILLVVSFLISLPSQLLLISASLSINDALYHVPTFYIFWIFGSITTGAIFYEEMASFQLANWLLFSFGVATLVVGVVLTTVAARRKPVTS